MEKNEEHKGFAAICRQAFHDNVYHHPVLVGAYGISGIVFTATNLRNGVVLSLILLCLLLPVCILSNLFYRRLPRQFRAIVIVMTSALVYVGVVLTLSDWLEHLPALYSYCIPILLVSPLLISRADKFSMRYSLLETLIQTLCCWLAFALAACITGAVREFCAYGTLYGRAIFSSPITLTMTQAPFFGMIVLGFVVAGIKAFRNSGKRSKRSRRNEMSDWRS